MAAGCGPDTEMPAGLDGLTGELVLTRQRDLLDRGLINVLTSNRTGDDIVITERALVADHFETVIAPSRRSSIRQGRDIALQVPYGSATDCTADDPVEAHLRITYTTGKVELQRTAAIDLGGTDILDDVRAEQCAARAFDEATDVAIEDVTVDDRVVTATLVVRRASGESSLAIEAMAGTVLVDVDAAPGASGPVAIGTAPVEVPITFVVNRCDPHALAEVTKRYGLDLQVSIDDAPARPVPVDVTELIPALDQIVERCTNELG
jgi:hypothetical protein